jgi:poly(3-hydroxybutyrate) depolymerase
VKSLRIGLAALLVVLIAQPLAADSFAYKGRQRTYVVSAPSSSKPLGVFVVLHCNGGNGSLAVGRWAKIVHPDGVMCVGPNSLNQGDAWRDQENEGIDFVKALVDDVARRYRIDRKRIYLGGYSAGACQACRIGIPNSDYFAGIMTYAGCSGPALGPRKIPVALVHGEKDGNIKVDGTRQLHQMLKDAGWPVWYKEIPGQGHSYNGSYDPQAWEWVKTHPPQDPPELVSKQKLEDAKEAFGKGNYKEAYEAYKAALDTGINKEDAEKGMKEIEELGAKEIEEALNKAGESKSRAKRYIGKIQARYKDTPVAEKAKEELDKFLEKNAEKKDEQEAEKDEEEAPEETPVEKHTVTAEELMEKADKYIGMGMNAAARQYLQRILDDFPDSPLCGDARRKIEKLEE